MSTTKARRKKRYKKHKIFIPVFFISSLILTGLGIIVGSKDVDGDHTINHMEENSQMEVHFLDMGQSDSTLIVCDGHAMLIDTGDGDQGTKIQLYLSKHGIKKLDYLVLTHPDADHIGGADVVITKFDINNILQIFTINDYLSTTYKFDLSKSNFRRNE